MFSDDEEGPYYSYREALLADIQLRPERYERVAELSKFLQNIDAEMAPDEDSTASSRPYRHLQAEVLDNAKSLLADVTSGLPGSVTINHVYWPNQPKKVVTNRVDIAPTERSVRQTPVMQGVITDVAFEAKLLGDERTQKYVLSIYPGYIRPVIRTLKDFKAQRKLQKSLESQIDA